MLYLPLGIAVAWSIGVLFAFEMGPAQLTVAMAVTTCVVLCRVERCSPLSKYGNDDVRTE